MNYQEFVVKYEDLLEVLLEYPQSHKSNQIAAKALFKLGKDYPEHERRYNDETEVKEIRVPDLKPMWPDLVEAKVEPHQEQFILRNDSGDDVKFTGKKLAGFTKQDSEVNVYQAVSGHYVYATFSAVDSKHSVTYTRSIGILKTLVGYSQEVKRFWVNADLGDMIVDLDKKDV